MFKGITSFSITFTICVYKTLQLKNNHNIKGSGLYKINIIILWLISFPSGHSMLEYHLLPPHTNCGMPDMRVAIAIHNEPFQK